YSEIISGNTTIPVILTDAEGNISSAKNVDFDPTKVRVLTAELKEQFSVYPPIAFDYYAGNLNYFYYTDSKPFTEIKQILDELIQSFITDVVVNSASVPVVVTDESRQRIVATGNLDTAMVADTAAMLMAVKEMATSTTTIEIDLGSQGKRYIFYRESYLLTQLRYFPLVQLGVIGVFLLIAYLLFSTARRSEQSQVWAGLAKETAHQLGTPLSSLMGWLELLKAQNVDDTVITEISKDLIRLDTITQRFSKIGSPPRLEPENIVGLIHEAVLYLRPRISRKVNIVVQPSPEEQILLPLNRQLFEWVIENLCRNAVDAMEGEGDIHIVITEEERFVHVDVSDTGKGIPKNMFKTIFNPGYTSKKRGWGLGLSLASRIIRNYHKGRIFVRSSVPGKGTTFRITLRINAHH
ncbi:MAG: HAMP domain-containing histidine kinase, partial [Bacteroidales bacterium]|nr:HAMP domain-containing histidine kinase [Bacteroidales bacterium]